MRSLIVEAFSIASRHDPGPTMTLMVSKGFYVWLLVSMPVLIAVFVLGIMGNYFQIGFIFTTEQLKFDLTKIDPIKGFKNLFQADRFFEMLKQIVKFALVTYVVYITIRDSLHDVILTQRMELETSIGVAAGIIKSICFRVALLFVAIAAADFFWQRHSFTKKMMMSHYEVKQEYKQSEGDPQLKGERKRLAYEMLMHGSIQKVATADAVITNPAHIAVAIQYNKEKHGAPVVIAKGMRRIAEQIRGIARQNRVPIMRNVPLAAALNKLDVDEEIPEELYEAVAEVLNFVYELKKQGKV